ncbi:MAG TPA: hypothetical protein VKH19_20320, partial [Gemmatimonadaceae bacterium]|nr:hypothetical protein [Gemmatimonadaceae bacterium]
VAAEQVSARYSILELITRKIDLRAVKLVRPLIVLDRPPHGKWNYQRIFPPSDTTKPQRVRRQGFPWIVLHDVAVLDGHLIMRTPWKPDTTLSRAAQDSSIHEALGGGKRIMVVPRAPGYQKIVELRSLTAQAPLLRITQPGFKERLAQIVSLQTIALPFRPPAAIVNDLAGNLRFNNDSIWWADVAVQMPGSSLRGGGRYVFTTGDMTIDARARPAAFADFRFVFPRFPSEGGGTLDFAMEWRGTTEEYAVQNADVHTMGARMRGRFAISYADTFAIHDTDVRFSNVSTKLIEQLVPGFDAPRRGTLDGQLAIYGGRNAMQLNGDVAFHDPGTGTSRVIGGGAVGYAHGEFRMRNLKVRAAPLQVALVKALVPSLAQTIPQIGGTITGTVNLNGSTRTALAVAGDVEHRDRGGVSNLAGSAGIRLAGVPSFNVDVRARPLSLAEVGLLAPAIGLRGSASGPIKLRGTLGDMRISTALQLSSGGWVRADGRVDLAGPTKSYDLISEMQVVNLNSVVAKAPQTSLTGKLTAKGSGFDPATMRAALAADFRTSSWKGVAVDRVTARLAIADGLARVSQLDASAAKTRIQAAGSFGLRADRSGDLRYSVAIDSLGAYDEWIPGTRTGIERPRTGLVARAFERARADSVRVARATEVERAATGRMMPSIPVDTPSSLARSVTTGRVYAAGTLRGNIKNFDTRGRLSANDVILRGNSVRSLAAEYAWTDARTSHSTIAVGVEGGQMSVKGFAFDTLSGRLSYHKPSGELQLAVRQGEQRDYSARASFVLGPSKRSVRLNDLALRMDTTVWRLAHAAEVHWHSAGV